MRMVFLLIETKIDILTNNELMNELISHKAVYRTTPATPDMLKILTGNFLKVKILPERALITTNALSQQSHQGQFIKVGLPR